MDARQALLGRIARTRSGLNTASSPHETTNPRHIVGIREHEKSHFLRLVWRLNQNIEELRGTRAQCDTTLRHIQPAPEHPISALRARATKDIHTPDRQRAVIPHDNFDGVPRVVTNALDPEDNPTGLLSPSEFLELDPLPMVSPHAPQAEKESNDNTCGLNPISRFHAAILGACA